MDLVPPWSLAKRQEWAERHPWLAGVYGGLAGSAVAVYAALRGSVGFAVFLALFLWFMAVPLVALSIKRRWGQRPDAEDHPRPTLLRLWSRTSDRWLRRFMWFYAVLAFVSVFVLLFDEDGGSAALTLFISVMVAVTTWLERRRRRVSP